MKKKPNVWKRIDVVEMHKVTKEKIVDGFFCVLVDVSVCVCLMQVMVSKDFVVCFVWIMFKNGGGGKLLALCEWSSFGYGKIGGRIDSGIKGGSAWRIK
jgi:hypothetical protein